MNPFESRYHCLQMALTNSEYKRDEEILRKAYEYYKFVNGNFDQLPCLSDAGMLKNPTIQSYDPNIHWAKHTFEIELRCWDYGATHTVSIGGNCRGASLFESAISDLYDHLSDEAGEGRLVSVTLRRETDGETLLCQDYEERGEDWLKGMVVSIRLIGHEEEEEDTP